MSPGIEVSALDHVHLYVSDIDAAVAWYNQVLGLQRMPSSRRLDAGAYMATARGQYCATIFPGRPPSDGDHTTAFRVPGTLFTSFGEQLDDLHLQDRHGGVLAMKDAVDHGLAWSYYFADPDGNHLELTTYDHQRVRDWASGEAHGA